jgi:hypothetical protein
MKGGKEMSVLKEEKKKSESNTGTLVLEEKVKFATYLETHHQWH